MVTAVEALPSPAASITNGATESALVQQRSAMGQALGDEWQSPRDAAIRPLDNAEVTHACPRSECGPPPHAAAVLRRKAAEGRADREHHHAIEFQLEEGGHL